MPKINPNIETFAKIKVIGVGGSGKGAINHMINNGTMGVDFIAVNADVQDLHHSLADKKIHIGKNFTKGLGAGMDPEKGHRAAEETKEELHEAISGADMCFIACGMGGGTGTGASPVIAKIAREEGILTIGVVTKPFFFEGRERMRIAEEGLAELEKEVDAMIVIPNDRILASVDQKTSVRDAFSLCNEVLRQAVEGISDLITTPGTYGNIDFADIKTILQNSGTALMGVGIATGERRAVEAATKAINSPLLDISISGAKGVLFSIAGADDLSMWEMQEAAKIIIESVDKDAKIISGTTIDEEMKPGEVKVTVIATGFPTPHRYSTGFERKETFGVIKNVESDPQPSLQPSTNIRSFFSGSAIKTDQQRKIEKTEEVIEEGEDEEEEEIAEDTAVANEEEEVVPSLAAKKTAKIFERVQQNKKEKEVEVVAEIDDSDDWSSSIPSILRRNR
jgi:cell division protein FtsZ